MLRKNQKELIDIVKDSVTSSLKKFMMNETHTKSLYHFISPSQLYYIGNYGLKLGDTEKEYSISKKLPYYLSLSRNRNAVQGFPYMNSKYSGGGGTFHNEAADWIIIRLELDGFTLNKYGKIRPFDYIYQLNKEEYKSKLPKSSKDEISDMTKNGGPNKNDEEIYNQPFSQAEERLYGKINRIRNKQTLELIKRIDIWVDIDKMDEERQKNLDNLLMWANKKFTGIKIFLYTKINEFNLQATPT